MFRSVPGHHFLYRDRLRPAVRHAALDVLAGIETVRKPPRSAGVHFVYLHSVGPRQHGEFRWLLRTMKRRYAVVSYSAAVDLLAERDVDRPYACISFDDGFASCIDASRILVEEGLTACFFVCSSLIGRPRSVIVEAFPGGLADETRTMTWDEVSSLLDVGHEVGSHTRTHPVLSSVDPDRLEAEIIDSKTDLEARLAIDIRHFAWPRGRFQHFTAEGARLARQAGYVSCASAERGSHAPVVHDEFPCIRREHVLLDWPRRHIEYFLRAGGRGTRITVGEWPESWKVA